MNARQRALAHRMNRRALDLYAELGQTPRCVDVRDWGDLWRKTPGEPLLPVRELEPCGTTAAYNRHLRRDETPCGLCKEAHAALKRSGRGTRRGRYAA